MIDENKITEAVVPEPPQAPQPNSTFDYAQMTRQQRRAYEKDLQRRTKENINTQQ